MTDAAAPSTTRVRELAGGRAFLGAVLGGMAAGAVNVVVYFVATAIGVSFTAHFPPPGSPAQTLPSFQPFVATVVPSLVAGGLVALLNLFTKRPSRMLIIVSAIVLPLSFVNPFMGIPDGSLALKLTLNVMHIVAAVGIVGGALRLGRKS